MSFSEIQNDCLKAFHFIMLQLKKKAHMKQLNTIDLLCEFPFLMNSI